MSRGKEIAKFACGAEAFHALIHAVFGLSGTTFTILGITVPPNWNIVGVVVNAVIAAVLGIYAWGTFGKRIA